ncbi:MAG: hypothetical protein ACREV0_01365 [Burkholderiales bacterium]
MWSIAAAFLALNIGIPALFDQAVQSRWIPDSLVLPNAAKLSAHCPSENEPRTKLSDARLREVRYAAWRLGFEVGVVAGLAAMGRLNAATQSQSSEWLTNIARNLNVPAPLPPEIGQSANALHEFAVHIETDPQCTAATLSQHYGEGERAIYKLSAYIGHSASSRIAVPESGAHFVPNIRHHAQSANVPERLLQPLLQDSVGGKTAEEEMRTAVNRLDEYFRTGN